jgi:eukaryotic-like serine/threonine-protein kinase
VKRASLSEATPLTVRSRNGNDYELVECIGIGATGAVYRAVDTSVGCAREVCIKRLLTPVARSSIEDLQREARLLSSVRHANVVSLLGVGQEPSGVPFLVLELVSGPDLHVLSRGLKGLVDPPGSLPWRLSVHVACCLLRALGAVGRALPGMVHRDVTPHNVVVSAEGEVKLVDFGIALTGDHATRATQGVVRGKIGYMAPEQIRGQALDSRTDIFAIGVILFELLAGRRPAAGKGHGELWAIERGQLDSLGRRRPDLDPRLTAIVDRLLALSPTQRYSSPDEALVALAPFGAGETGPLRMAELVRRVLPDQTGSEADARKSVVGRRSETTLETRDRGDSRVTMA